MIFHQMRSLPNRHQCIPYCMNAHDFYTEDHDLQTLSNISKFSKEKKEEER